jgi:outer membrane biosynthesis protein TonB
LTTSALQTRRDQSATWTLAILAALLTHAVLLAAVEWLGIFDPPDRRVVPEPIDIVFTQPATTPSDEAVDDEPTQFSELPEDRADVAPEDPDFLSNVDSRARDRAVAEEETDMPRMDGRSESPHVELAEPSADQVESSTAGEEGTREQPAPNEAGGEEARLDRDSGDPATRTREGVSLDELLRDPERGRRGDPGPGEAGRSGRPGRGDQDAIRESRGEEPRYSLRAHGSAFFQEQMNNPGGNVSLFGDISLNTLNWEFAPWIQRFVRDYHRNWFPPYAYGLGIISGYEVVDLEVAPDGRLLRLEVLEEEGHEALTESTLTAFRAFAPYHPLPDDFPEPTLRLRVKVIYPDWR